LGMEDGEPFKRRPISPWLLKLAIIFAMASMAQLGVWPPIGTICSAAACVLSLGAYKWERRKERAAESSAMQG